MAGDGVLRLDQAGFGPGDGSLGGGAAASVSGSSRNNRSPVLTGLPGS